MLITSLLEGSCLNDISLSRGTHWVCAIVPEVFLTIATWNTVLHFCRKCLCFFFL